MADPKCPTCDSPMVLRMARRGRNAGNEFWGCTRYPQCRGTRDASKSDSGALDDQKAPAARAAASLEANDDAPLLPPARVPWSDSATSPGWRRTYTIGGGSLRSTDLLAGLEPEQRAAAERRTSQAFIATADLRSGAPSDPQVLQVVGTVRKILQRGDRPPLDPDAERALLLRCGVDAFGEPLDDGDLSFSIESTAQLPSDSKIASTMAWSDPRFELDPGFSLDSPEEAQFVTWAVDLAGPTSARWLYPQASLDKLVGTTGSRRVDFLFAPPWREPVVIEIDGLQHKSSEQVDDDRDEQLGDAGIAVLRVPAREVRDGKGPAIDVVGEYLRPPAMPQPSAAPSGLLMGPTVATHLGLAILECVERGWLPGAETWRLDVHDPLEITDIALGPFLELFASVDELWAGFLAPAAVEVTVNGRQHLSLQRRGPTSYDQRPGAEQPTAHAVINLEPHRSPQDALPQRPGGAQVIVRTSTLPVSVAEARSEGEQLAVLKDPGVVADSAQRILRFVFAKKDYREGQEQALIQVLQRRDSVVLLPTGAGKSLIYQLAGLILPGRTIIIDPIVALMEDQIEGLREQGIDRALGISGFVTRQGRIDEAFELVSNGAALFLFLSPERLQQREFRQALRELTVGTPVNLAVIDEAHCISEWGHDFRTAYLDLGRNLRELCASVGGDAPPLLALTGTASRAVLRDVLIELEIDRGDPGAIVKPESFDRRELSFEVVMAEVGESHARLAGYMRALPTRPDMYPDGFYEPRGMRSSLGIVFCPHVNGKFGISEVSALLRERDICSHVGLYSGSAPRGFDRRGWEHEKRRNARRFRNGELPVLASTKAFGMGVDVPNIRYTVHFGLPPSIEAFYQEAGRAGRDRREARCAVIFTEASEATTRSMLSEDIDGEQARAAYEGQDRRNNDDDITRQLWFHYGSFPGVDEELDHVDQVLSGLNWNGIQRTLSIPFGGDAKFEKLRERAIHRLSLVGVVGSYLKDWGGKSFEITTTDAAARDLDSAFLDYVARTQPGRLGAYETEVADVAAQSLSDRASKLASMALGLLYDTIEKSRRRALREMANLARDSKGDAEIRQRIEDYFREGDLAPLMQNLVEAKRVALADWIEILVSVGRDDEGELRGTSARYLESYPDHPGLLLSRSVAELMAGVDLSEFMANVEQMLSASAAEYQIPADEIESSMAWLLGASRRFRPDWAAALWVDWDKAGGPIDSLIQAEDEALADESTSGSELVAVLERRLTRWTSTASQLAERRTE